MDESRVPSAPELRAFLLAFASPRPFVILGAGASVPIAPRAKQLREIIRRDFAALGCWPCGGNEPDAALFDRVFWDFVPETHEDLLLFSNRGRLALFVQRALTVPLSKSIPPQYAVFKWAPRGTTLFNYNLDGLATHHLGKRLRVSTPHGSLDREWTASPDFMRYLGWSLDFDLPSWRPKLLPGPEPTTVTDSTSFRYARTPLADATAVVIIGYSFALNPFGKLDDNESFEYFIDIQTRASCPILVVNDRPTTLVDRIRDRFKSKRVQLVQMRWDLFSSALLPLLGPALSMGDMRSDSGIKSIGANYAGLL
jgi:hypothetical protein